MVANEVKELAKETAKATEDISRKIGAIASAVEEQNATMNEMARNVSDAAHGSGEITSNIAGVAQAAESTSRGAGDAQPWKHFLELRRAQRRGRRPST